ncbi:MAG: hypothetical protein ACI845_002980 [Gammaproteobacteria bacterium]|jgi:hypothetical protein
MTLRLNLKTLTPGTSEVEVKGTITQLPLQNNSFRVSGVSIVHNNSTEFEIEGGSLKNGLFVEAEGILQSDSSILAEEIESEDRGFEDQREINLQGIDSFLASPNSL